MRLRYKSGIFIFIFIFLKKFQGFGLILYCLDLLVLLFGCFCNTYYQKKKKKKHNKYIEC